MKRKNLCLLLCLALAAGSWLPSLPAAASEIEDQQVEAAMTEGFALDEELPGSRTPELSPGGEEAAADEAASEEGEGEEAVSQEGEGEVAVSEEGEGEAAVSDEGEGEVAASEEAGAEETEDEEASDDEALSFLADSYVYADYKYIDRMDQAYCYYYNHMSDRQQGVYAAFLNAAQDPMDLTVYHFADKFGKGYTMTSQEVTDTYQGFLFDHPECWWMGLRYLFSRTRNEEGQFDNNFVTGVRLYQAYSSKDDWNKDMAAMEAAADAYLAAVDRDAPPAVIALELHDRLIDQVDYDNTADKYSRSHNAAGALLSRQAVCDGYSLAYKYLLRKAGINCTVIPGDVHTGKHAWNAVSLDGEWYETDPTWNDQQKYAEQHLYYNLTTAQLSGDVAADVKHVRDFEGFTSELPVAKGTHFTYEYMKAGLSLDEKRSTYTYMDNTNLTNDLSLVFNGKYSDEEWTLKAVDLNGAEIGPCVWKLTPVLPRGLTLFQKWTAGTGSFKVKRTGGEEAYTLEAAVIYDNGLTSEPSLTLRPETGSGDTPAPGGDTPTPGGDTPAPGGDTPASGQGILTKKGKATYCMTKDGKYLTGFQEISGELYYFDPSTKKMVTGWNTINGKKYYMRASDGVVRRGMRSVSGVFYYFDPLTGSMETGYRQVDKNTYYFLPKTGVRATGWQKIGEGKAYFSSTGKMYTGIRKVDDYSYYFDPVTGLRSIGFTEVDGAVYYMNQYGRIQYGLKTIDGFRYYFAASGKMQTGWQTINGKKYYFYKKGERKGRAATGTAKIGDTWYTFSDKGVYRKKGK